MTDTHEVVVAGAGNAGLCAALSAAEHGARVLVLQKAPREERGGNTFFTGGAFRSPYKGFEDIRRLAPDMSEAEAASVDVGSYTEASFRDDLVRVSEGLADPDLVETLVAQAQRELQELVRYRKGLINQRAQVINRIQKVLEGANIKLGAVARDVVGVSGRAMLEALIAGEADAQALADLVKGRLRSKRGELEEALRGLVGPHQRFLLQSQLRQLDFLDQEIAHLSDEIAERMRPFEDALQRLDAIPSVGRRAAEQVLAEIGADVRRFPSSPPWRTPRLLGPPLSGQQRERWQAQERSYRQGQPLAARSASRSGVGRRP